METVTIKRATLAHDGYGNPIPGDLEVVGTVEMLVAPLMSEEPVMLGRSPIEVNYNLFTRGQATGILADDILTVRGEDVPVDGRVQSWQGKRGEHRGDQVQIRLTVG